MYFLRMKRFVITCFIFLLAIIFATGMIACNHRANPENSPIPIEKNGTTYQCPMHPWITSKEPAKCSICGMNLTPVSGGGSVGLKNSSDLKLTEATAAVIGVATTEARVAVLHRTLRVSGVIDDDETRHRILSARVPGRIEKLHVNQVGVEVVQDQPLAEIYGPDVLTAQRLYLENFRLGATNTVAASEVATSREKLLALGLLESDIQHIEKTSQLAATLAVRAPFGGTIVSRKAYEGQYVKENDELFEIGDFSSLWFIFDAYERDLPWLKLNQQVDVTLPSLPGETFSAPIAFIDPNLDERTRTARVRVVLANPERRILHRQTADGVVHLETMPTLLVPRSAILYTRENPVAYVAQGDGHYQLRNLKLGKIGDHEAEILEGVSVGEKIVSQAALLIDAQSQLEHFAANPTETTVENHVLNNKENSERESTMSVQTLSPELLQGILKMTAALSGDDLDAYQKTLPSLMEAVKRSKGTVHETLMPLAEKLVSGPDLKTVRMPFEPLSNAIADMVRNQSAADRQAKIFQCPMSPVLGTARWLQKDNAKVLNPFFGSAMLHCGDELK